MNYHIGTGYYDKRYPQWADFLPFWMSNTRRFSNPSAISVIACGGSKVGVGGFDNVIQLKGDLGYVMDLINGIKPHRFNGGAAAILTLAMIAFNDECDFLYKEQDCLAFGPYVERMYEALGDGGICFGKLNCFPVAFSLVLIKHKFIPDFVRWYLGTERENSPDTILENKMKSALRSDPKNFRQFSFGYDRDRPVNYSDEVFYIQCHHYTEQGKAEFSKLIELGLL